MSGAPSSEDRPGDMVTAEIDATDRKVFHIKPKNADPAKRRTYTRSEVNERMDRIAESLDAPDRLVQRLIKDPVSPALTSARAKNASMLKFATNFPANSAVMTALADMTRPYDKIAKAIGPNIPMGIDWGSVVPPISVKVPGNLLGASLVKGLSAFDGMKGVAGLGGISSRFAEALDDLEERYPSKFAGIVPAVSSTVAERRHTDFAMPELPPHPAHETNKQLRELLAITRVERDQLQRDREEEKARDAEREAQRRRERKSDRRITVVSVAVGVVGTIAGVVGTVAAVLALG